MRYKAGDLSPQSPPWWMGWVNYPSAFQKIFDCDRMADISLGFL
jgi:hypothetical protein